MCPARTPLFVVALACLAAVLGGCTQLPFGLGRGATRIASLSQPTEVRPRFTTIVHAPSGDQIGDIYLTDLPEGSLTDPDTILQQKGQILHLHFFVRPRPGHTPIDPSAINTAVRYAVLTEGPAGLYAGGGFMLPSGAITDKGFGGSLLDGSLRLAGSSQGFADRLGTARLEVSFNSSRNPDAAAALAAALDRLALIVTPVESGEVAPSLQADRPQDDLDDPDLEPDLDPDLEPDLQPELAEDPAADLGNEPKP